MRPRRSARRTRSDGPRPGPDGASQPHRSRVGRSVHTSPPAGTAYPRGVTITLRAAAAAVLALGLAMPAASADARGHHWTTVVKVHRAKFQACKVPTTQHGPWKVRFRLDATRATTSVRGEAEVDKGDKTV